MESLKEQGAYAVISIPVSHLSDVGNAKRTVRQFAQQIGFHEEQLSELDVVTTELATNLLVHHTVDGEIIVKQIHDTERAGIEVISQDKGPGIPDIKKAIKDHHSTGNSIGCGLGMIRRLMDEFDIYSCHKDSEFTAKDKTIGSIISVRKWLPFLLPDHRFVYSCYSRPKGGEKSNGDAFLIHEDRDGIFIAVSDGLGHGAEAENGSRIAMDFIRNNHKVAFDVLFSELHEKLVRTRGIALTLVRISYLKRVLHHASVGNVQARVYPRKGRFLMAKGGIVGVGRMTKPKINAFNWPENGLLFIFTDGLSSRWDLADIPKIDSMHVTTMTHFMMKKYGKAYDDATIVIVKEEKQ